MKISNASMRVFMCADEGFSGCGSNVEGWARLRVNVLTKGGVSVSMKVRNVSMKGSGVLNECSQKNARLKGSPHVIRPWRGWRGLGRRTA